jgi:cyclase
MLRPRIIPCLLIRNKGLVKTEKFKEGKYVGDPLNAVKIFNEKEVDELIVLDIDASVERREPDFDLIRMLAMESRMPLCYGGGVRTIEQVKKIISLGIEKVAVSSAAVENPEIIKHMANVVGSQSIVVVIDVKAKGLFGKQEVVTLNGNKSHGISPIEFAKKCQDFGAGEIVINSVDRDGMMIGYDVKLISEIRNQLTLPMTVLGGAGTLTDLSNLIKEFGVIGAAAGSLFVFKGKFKAVLINYPNKLEKKEVLKASF